MSNDPTADPGQPTNPWASDPTRPVSPWAGGSDDSSSPSSPYGTPPPPAAPAGPPAPPAYGGSPGYGVPPAYGAAPPAYGAPASYGSAPPPAAYPAYGGGYPMGREHPQGTLVLILGILGIVVCGVCAPFAWVMGRRAMREIDSSGQTFSNRGQIQAGMVCGIVGTVLWALGFIIYAVMIIGVLGMAASTSTVR